MNNKLRVGWNFCTYSCVTYSYECKKSYQVVFSIFLLEADSHAILFQLVLRIFTKASGYLVPNMIRFDQNRVLRGLFWWENCSPEILSSIKSDQMIFFAGLFQPLLNVIENAFARDIGGIIQLCMGYRLGVCGV